MSDRQSSSPVIRNIAIATDFSPWSERAMQHALVTARQFGAVLHILHAVRRSEFPFAPDIVAQLDQLARRDCNRLVKNLNSAHTLDHVEHHCWNVDGEVSDVFGSFVREHKIDLLVLGTRGRSGLSKLLLGSVARQIFQHVSCPVLTVGPWSRGAGKQVEVKKMLFATDLSAESTEAIPYVLAAAKAWQAEIDVLHVCSSANFDCVDAMETFRRRMDGLAKEESQCTIRYHLLPGRASQAVLDFAKENKQGLIVLGLDRCRSVYCGPFLSHAYEIVRKARCPVLSARSAAVSIHRRFLSDIMNSDTEGGLKRCEI
jgi:nucleotide-binding universal stress UspA family protein